MGKTNIFPSVATFGYHFGSTMKPMPFLPIAGLLSFISLPMLTPLALSAKTPTERSGVPQAIVAPVKQPMTSAKTFRNPLKKNGADPCLTYYKGWYYLSTTTGGDIQIRRARKMAELHDAPDQVVWKDDHPERFRDMWAAEFHRLEGPNGARWYLYYTASDGKEGDTHHRMYVLESSGDDPRGPYTFKAKLKTDPDDKYYAIDGTVLKLSNGTLYFIWCGRPSTTGQGLYISRMTDPWTLTGLRTYLPADGFGGPYVREAPVTLVRKGKVFLIYSAWPADTPDYKLGMLGTDESADLMNPDAWKQYPKTVFARVDQYGVYGPGHNFFFKSPDGKQDWIVYHAKGGIGNTYADRSARAQPFTWNADGTPNFGLPLPVDQDIPAPSGEK
jgi:GH43 family beta-xylosidase